MNNFNIRAVVEYIQDLNDRGGRVSLVEFWAICELGRPQAEQALLDAQAQGLVVLFPCQVKCQINDDMTQAAVNNMHYVAERIMPA